MRSILSWSFVIATFALTACQSPAHVPKNVPPDVADGGGGVDDSARVRTLWQDRTAGGVRTEPCLGPGDLLEISVFHWPDMQGYRARVSPAGTIALPMLGTVKAAGLTETELRDQIANGLKRNIMRDPQVSVFVAERVSQQVSVTGAVARPGLYGLSRDHRTVSDMLSEAGGLAEMAGGKVLLYPVKGSVCDASGAARPPVRTLSDIEPVEIDLNAQYARAEDNALALPVVGGDSIVVNRGRFLVDGWVEKPGAYDIAPGMTAFGGVSAAGGALFPADLDRLVVWRPQRGGTKKKIEVNMSEVKNGGARDVTLEAGDVVQVPMSAVKMVPYSAYWVMTTVVRVGASFPIF